ncbi:hypothetical protein GGI04_003103 [Coemansia thaxteri]|uniref:Uncharacterized protein n=1 Tax=Coemansia thaxteri TaxID=2663907 RepID=A0A9W8BHV7_9FUNG|nr:hypothetical protein GGI04_003103 [Coemansia thaxteri]KAJ2007317.1 hypothetical protein H4R26_000848 [Coemansia thaxteri]KAJ2470432.1 hypothetical protein GGI02_002936 [Coemansia sp. RSA 2322]KAJ2486729.1 hypothetical protein EV174_000952 [Coemansia sp. RSA 2320]
MLAFTRLLNPRIAAIVVVCTTLVALLLFHGELHLSLGGFVGEGGSGGVRPKSLAVIMPVNDNSDLTFYKNMWVGDYLRPVCDFAGPECSMSCNEKSTWNTLHKKTVCFTKQLKEKYTDTEFFIKLDDDAFTDREYIYGLMNQYTGMKEPVYISDFILNLDRSNPSLNGSYYGNGKFYMFNRPLLDCIDTNIRYRGDRNEDAVFGAMVHNGCGPDVKKILENDSKIWHKNYTSKNKHIELNYVKNH